MKIGPGATRPTDIMPTLTFDRKVPLCEQRLRVALSKCKRKQGKKHVVGKRNHAIRVAKKTRAAAIVKQRNDAIRNYKKLVRLYWSGALESHPDAPI